MAVCVESEAQRANRSSPIHPNILLRLSRRLEGKVKYGGFPERSREDGPGSCPGRVATIPGGHRGYEEGSEGIVRSGASPSIRLQRYTSTDRAWSDDQRATRHRMPGVTWSL